MVGEHKILVDGERETIAQGRHDLRLLDGVNAQLAFKVLIHLDEFGRITGVLNDHFDHRRRDLIVADGRHGGRSCNRCSRGRRGRRRRRLIGLFLEAFEGLTRAPGVALHAAVEVVISVHVGDEFVVQHAKNHVVCSCELSVPCKDRSAVHTFTFNGPSSNHGKGDLRSETGSKSNAVFDSVDVATLAEVEVAQLWVHFLVVGDGREAAVVKAVDHARVFNADAHGVARESLRVRDEDFVRAFSERHAEGFDLRLS